MFATRCVKVLPIDIAVSDLFAESGGTKRARTMKALVCLRMIIVERATDLIGVNLPAMWCKLTKMQCSIKHLFSDKVKTMTVPAHAYHVVH
jgi:hypothetical protein